MVINLRGLDKYDSEHTVSWTNVREKIGQTYEQTSFKKQGNKNRRTAGYTDGRMEGRMDGRADRRMDIQTEGYMEIRTEGRTDGRMEVW